MSQRNFILTELKIQTTPNALYNKVLKDKSYKFNQIDFSKKEDEQPLERDIFGKRVFIQTIVGKNGSGKSSLLEIIYRIINNFSFYILNATKPKRVAAEPIYLIEKLYAELHFIIDDVECALIVRHKSLGVIRGGKKIFFGEPIDEFKDFQNFNDVKKDEVINLASSFFYTIVTNYSFQSLISKDFANDIAEIFIGSKKTGTSSNGNWLDSLFRKNDGYITPIVLNPYREDGKVDLAREYYLTLSRIAGLLVYTDRNKKELLDGYSLLDIRYKANHSHFIGKLFKKYDVKDDAIHLTELMMALQDKGTVANIILKAYGLPVPVLQNEIHIIPFAYLIYKTLSILKKYAQFEEYKNIPKIEDFHVKVSTLQEKELLAAIDEILRFKSHVNVKVYQTLNYIKSYNSLIEELSLSDYKPYMTLKKFNDLDEIIEHLPPPFYEQDVRLKRSSGTDIPLSMLSSGERQFVYTISTIIYHVKNLLSIQQSNRIRYRNINLILDEVEICFHPEYQRQFIGRLLDLFDRMNLTRNCSFNIIIVTHSPFILSDVPKNNILYLEDGQQKTDEQLINPYAANINDILYQSFFLTGGFIGEHAKNQINDAVNVLERIIAGKAVNKETFWTEINLKRLIDLVGEPLLKDNLTGLYLEAFKKLSYEEIINAKDKEIEDLKRRLSNQ
jgi:predicted ATPase